MENIWLEIDGNEMMITDFAVFLEFLTLNKMEYASYYGENETIVMEVTGDMTDEFDKTLNQFIYHQPIAQLDEEPNISDIDLIEEMSSMD